MSDRLEISGVELGEEEEKLVLEVLRSGQLAQGPMVERLEVEFARLCDVRHAIAVSSGTAALVAAIQTLWLRPGDEVVTSPFTFVATLNAILEAGAVARFADIDPTTFTIDPDALAAQITDRSRAVMPVHLYGQPATMDRIVTIAEASDAALIEDAAQAHGATFGNRPVGSFGIGCFSLYATKNVTSGEGGVITTDDDAVADSLRLLRNQGMRDRYQYELAGHNYRLTDLQAAVALPQLERLAKTNAARERNARRLCEGLHDVLGIVLPVVGPNRTHAFHQFTVRVTSDARLDREVLARRLAERGIVSGIYYPRVVFDYDCYRQHPGVVPSALPEAERAAREVLSLPVHPGLTDAGVDRIVDEVRALLGG